MRKLFLLFAVCALTSCQRGCTEFQKDHQFVNRNYNVKVYSGGKIVFEDTFSGTVNDAKDSDGIYYFNSNGELVEISGDYVIISK